MDLQTEYFERRKVPGHIFHYNEKAIVLLRSKESSNVEDKWMQISVEQKYESHHPPVYYVSVFANPVIYTGTNINQYNIGLNHQKTVFEQKYEWDTYEDGLKLWIATICNDYYAVTKKESVFLSWELFLTNYDSWFAGFFPYRIKNLIYQSLCDNLPEKVRTKAIDDVETWMVHKYDTLCNCWVHIRKKIMGNHYADWLVDYINDLAGCKDKLPDRLKV